MFFLIYDSNMYVRICVIRISMIQLKFLQKWYRSVTEIPYNSEVTKVKIKCLSSPTTHLFRNKTPLRTLHAYLQTHFYAFLYVHVF